jgi:ataxia telangiectasia mutated family protein
MYCALAAEKDPAKYKVGKKMSLSASPAGSKLIHMLSKCKTPTPTMQIPLRADMDYSKIPVVVAFDSTMSIASGVSAPKIITAVASNGTRYRQLVG